jgi:hypothetical protein
MVVLNLPPRGRHVCEKVKPRDLKAGSILRARLLPRRWSHSSVWGHRVNGLLARGRTGGSECRLGLAIGIDDESQWGT